MLAASSLFDPGIEKQTRAIVEAVQARGDEALLEFTERFGGARLTADQLAVSQAELLTASLQAGEALRAAVRETQRNVEAFARRSLRRNWQMRNSHGAIVGEKFDPFARVGVYIPGGAAPLVSTALMTIPFAKVAGCREIVVCTPCDKAEVNPAVLYAARHAGATEIYRVGGSQAIAAMVHGTKTIRRVQKVFGPGNAYVVAAKRLLYGYAAMDLLPGPSELLVLADETANASYAAADLLAQAEHGSGHERVWLVTTSLKLLAGGGGGDPAAGGAFGTAGIHPKGASGEHVARARGEYVASDRVGESPGAGASGNHDPPKPERGAEGDDGGGDFPGE